MLLYSSTALIKEEVILLRLYIILIITRKISIEKEERMKNRKERRGKEGRKEERNKQQRVKSSKTIII